MMVSAGLAAEKAAGTSLGQYLKRIGYEPVPMVLNKQHKHVVEGKLDGRRLKFIVDTGWSVSALGKAALHKRKTLSERGVKLIDPVLGELNSTNVVMMDRLELGRAEFFNQPALAKDLRVRGVRFGADAILGSDFLLRNHALVDCGTDTLYLRAAKPSEEIAAATVQSLRQSGFSAVPIEIHSACVAGIEVKGAVVSVILDTGSPYTVFQDSVAERLDWPRVRYDRAATGSHIPDEVKTLVVGIGTIGVREVTFARLSEIKLGARTWKNQVVGVLDLRAFGLGRPTREGLLEGLVGMDILARHRALIDYAGRTLWFPPEK